ncbi:MAG: hypothetical protein J5604_07480 [Bacteroidales bacterium]|nr:hypothetical protein [Bacteroidales bacterium]
MRTNRLYNALVAIVAAAFMVSTATEAVAQSSTRKSPSGGSATMKAAPSQKKMTPATDRNQSSGNRGNASNVNKGRNYNDHMGNVRTQSGINVNRPNNDNRNNGNHNNGNVTNNRPGGGNVNRPNNDNVNRPGKDNRNIVNRPGNDHNKGNFDRKDDNRKEKVNRPEDRRPTYKAPKDGHDAHKVHKDPTPKYDRSNPNRHLGYTPFRDGRTIHRPAPVHVYYDYGRYYRVLPKHHYHTTIAGLLLYFWDGVWYNYADGVYGVHRPPVGTVIPISYISSSLYPVDFEYESVGYRRNYYVDSYSNFYIQINSYELKVVDAPEGAILYDMPSDYTVVLHHGRTYYKVGSSIFEYVYTNANSWYFRAVGIYR